MEEILGELGAIEPKLVTLFASRDRDHGALNRALRDRLPAGARLIGASSAAEIRNDGVSFGAVVVSVLEGDLEVGVGLGCGLTDDALRAGSSAMKAACEQLGTRARDLDTSTHVGIVIDDGYKNKKEELLMGALEQNQGILLVGGGASCAEFDPAKQSALVHADGEVTDDCVAIALIRTSAPFATLRHHAYSPSEERISITEVSDDGYRALTLDGEPAAQHYAAKIGVEVEALPFGMPTGFSDRPLAMRVGREYFMRSPLTPLPDGSILFANLLEEGADYELMKLGDQPSAMRKFFRDELPLRVKNPECALLFHCNGRQYVAMQQAHAEELAAAFEDAPTCAGFNVQFETYCGFHINTTLTALVFGSDA
ncbi:MAG: FIST signal transduction protein [Sandaracinaceae bacterium]